MKLSKIIEAVEKRAPLYLQDDYDNSGLQVGMPDSDITGVLVCLDVTEEIVDEAVAQNCNLILSHHPLLFHPLRQVCGASYQQRCVIKALAAGIAIYSAHTSLDNAPGGVNFKIAGILGLEKLAFLSPREDGKGGSGIVGELSHPMIDAAFLKELRKSFGVECLRHSERCGRTIRKVAVCGGAGSFLMGEAAACGADCFVCGEFHYHDYFENKEMLLVEPGHYQSEQYTRELLRDMLQEDFHELRLELSSINTNPIRYDYDKR